MVAFIVYNTNVFTIVSSVEPTCSFSLLHLWRKNALGDLEQRKRYYKSFGILISKCSFLILSINYGFLGQYTRSFGNPTRQMFCQHNDSLIAPIVSKSVFIGYIPNFIELNRQLFDSCSKVPWRKVLLEQYKIKCITCLT